MLIAGLGTDLRDITFLSQTFPEIIESLAYFYQLIRRWSSDFGIALLLWSVDFPSDYQLIHLFKKTDSLPFQSPARSKSS